MERKTRPVPATNKTIVFIITYVIPIMSETIPITNRGIPINKGAKMKATTITTIAATDPKPIE